MNGEPNDALPIAVLALLVLCISLFLFFYHFSFQLAVTSAWAKIIRVSGLLSMLAAALIATDWHDEMIIVASCFGLFVIVGIMVSLVLSNLIVYKFTGAVCLLMLGLNNYIYYTQHGLHLLPLLQKLTFVIVLGWIIGLNWKLYQKAHVTS